MKQALHIFAKDVRRLWPLIVLVLADFTLFAFTAPSDGLGQFLLTVLCWTLTALAVLEDAPAQESPFWLTRPYNRGSLLAAKTVFVLAFVFLPLLIAGIVNELRASVDVLANAGTLLLLGIGRGAFLILPGLAVGAVTRTMKQFAGMIGALMIGFVACDNYAAVHWVARVDPTYSTDPNLILFPSGLVALAVIALQYIRRNTNLSAALIVFMVIATSLVARLDAITRWTVNTTNGRFDPTGIRITLDKSASTQESGNCFSTPLKVEGLPRGAALRAHGRQEMRLASRLLGTQEGRHGSFTVNDRDGYLQAVCLGGFGPEMLASLIVSVNYEVVTVVPIAKFPVRPGLQALSGAGECDMVTQFPPHLQCRIVEPAIGTVGTQLEYNGLSSHSEERIVPGLSLSPILLVNFDGPAPRFQPRPWFEEAMKHPEARFILQTERVIGYVHADLSYSGIVFPPTQPDRKVQ